MKRLKLGAALIAALSLVGLAGCASGNSESGTDGNAGNGGGKQITIGYINWDEDVAVTHLWQKVLEDKGYNVTIQQISDAGPTYVGLSKGNIDLYLDGWLPATHAAYWKKYGSQLTDLTTWYDAAPLTIAVPTYMKDINSIEDLKAHASEFDSTITGIEPGAGETGIVKKMMPQYGLSSWKLQTSSTSAMLAALKKATDAKKPIVVDLWRPHWAYTAFPIKDLKDPKGAMGKPDGIHAIGTGSFADDFPEVAAMVKKFHMDDKSLGSLEQTVLQDHKDDMDAGVEEWLKANPDFEKSLG
ncbi:glycine betaine ABC transporter substrate-binding protein [Nocardioides sp. DS6]|uniref:Glycine betaine ABC transporter substrate-binding protein n=1 Tax=Nocardioides eburneus TaxID=3231482 RepID=A0ABV3SVN5_9ACTN